MKKVINILGCLLAAITIFSCSNDEDNLTYQDTTVSFAVAQSGLDDKGEADIEITLSRAAAEDLNVTVGLQSADIQTSELTFTPGVENNQIVVTVPKGQTTAAIKVAKNGDATPEGEMTFTILSLSAEKGYKIGDTKECKLSSTPVVLDKVDDMTLQGKVGDQDYQNMVYVDMSTGKQTLIDRQSWDIAVESGDGFHVILNPAYGTTAASSGKTDFAAVTADDAAKIDLPGPHMPMGTKYVDDLSGDLSKTVFGEIPASESDAKVFFVATDNNKDNKAKWYKVKVSRTENGYKVEYGVTGDTTPKTLEVTKDAMYNFKGVSLQNGKISDAEPTAAKWDFRWSYGAVVLPANMGLYGAQDIVTINIQAGVEAALIQTSEKSYDAYSKADADKANFSKDADVIGSSWRATTGSPLGIKKDQFYVIKDVAGNYYKLQFLKMGVGGDGGTRGMPQLRYELLK